MLLSNLTPYFLALMGVLGLTSGIPTKPPETKEVMGVDQSIEENSFGDLMLQSNKGALSGAVDSPGGALSKIPGIGMEERDLLHLLFSDHSDESINAVKLALLAKGVNVHIHRVRNPEKYMKKLLNNHRLKPVG